MSMDPVRRCRRFMVTLNNYTQAELANFKLFCEDEVVARAICGREVAPGTGTPHLQAYIELVDGKTMSALKRALRCDRWHFDEARGTGWECWVYCGKTDNEPFVSGQPPAKAFTKKSRSGSSALNRNPADSDDPKTPRVGDPEDYAEVMARVLAGEDLLSLPGEMCIKHYSNLKLLSMDAHQARVLPPLTQHQAFWFWGAPGTGKSSWILRKVPQHLVYLKNPNSKWFDGVTSAHQVVQYDDIHPNLVRQGSYNGGCILTDLKLLGDLQPVRVEVKHGGLVIRPKLTIVTSQLHPMAFATGSDLGAIQRRFKVVEFTHDYHGDDLFPLLQSFVGLTLYEGLVPFATAPPPDFPVIPPPPPPSRVLVGGWSPPASPKGSMLGDDDLDLDGLLDEFSSPGSSSTLALSDTPTDSTLRDVPGAPSRVRDAPTRPMTPVPMELLSRSPSPEAVPQLQVTPPPRLTRTPRIRLIPGRRSVVTDFREDDDDMVITLSDDDEL